MDSLKQAIRERGEIINEDVLKVDSFLNHQIDWKLMLQAAQDIYEHFKHEKINKIVTIETSGIAPALYTAQLFDVPLVFLKKSKPSTMNQDIYQTNVHSFTKQIDYTLSGSSSYLNKEDHVLLIDDFLANGEACLGALNILKQAQASVAGIAVLIEKAHQKGHQRLLELGYEVYALARIDTMNSGVITFLEEES